MKEWKSLAVAQLPLRRKHLLGLFVGSCLLDRVFMFLVIVEVLGKAKNKVKVLFSFVTPQNLAVYHCLDLKIVINKKY